MIERQLPSFIAASLICCAAMTGPLQAQTQPALPQVLRLGYLAPKDIPCAAPDKATPTGLAAYAQHIAARLELRVELCGFSTYDRAAAAFGAGKVDFAPLNGAVFGAAKGKAQPILTLRAAKALPRTTVVAIAKTDMPAMTAQDIASRRVVVAGPGALSYEGPRAAIASHGGSALLQQPTPMAGSFAKALEAIAAAKADVALLPADSWAVGCAKAKEACSAFHVVWADRPVPETALALRSGLPAELRYRLIGIFLPLAHENPQAFHAVAAGDGTFEPTESTALIIGPHH